MMEGKEPVVPLFPLVRYRLSSSQADDYYAIGNTPANDLLESCVGVAEPLVLSLGCGDIRSCFYTLWKHFDPSVSSAPQRFDGVQFLLNDCSSGVLARNILFLLLCLKLPDGTEERKEWLSAMWAVWYCLELFPLHQKILDDGLKLLLKYSVSCEEWSGVSNPLHDLVHFTSPVVLAEISRVWKAWLEGCFSVKEMHASREKLFKFRIYCFEEFEEIASEVAHNVASRMSLSIKGDYSEAKEEAVIPGINGYIKSGNCYIESVVKMETRRTPTTANSTLYERLDGTYSLFYSSNPFFCYHHAVEFSPQLLREAGVEKHFVDALLVEDKSFKEHPLLANCIQQFCMWVQSSSAALNKKLASFTFNNQDAIQFCQEYDSKEDSSQFDVIHTSNLIDYLGIPNVVLCALPLLKMEGFLYTQTMLYKLGSSESVVEFLEMSFGFDCKLLPVITGARCINHEGLVYTSPVMSQPTPERRESAVCSLIWQKLSAQPIVISELPPPESGNITNGLVQSFVTSTLPLVTKFELPDDIQVVLAINIETALLVLQRFASFALASASSISDYHFWEPLCKGVMEPLKPFLSGLQTQALLHNMHMHFTVNEESCPICKCCPVEEYIGLFCVEVPRPGIGPFNFTAYIHRRNVPLWGKNVHIIDCIDGSVQHGNKIRLRFFAPKHFAAKGFNVSITLSAIVRGENHMCPKLLHTTALRSVQVDFEHYNFVSLGHSVSNSVPGYLVSNLYTQDNVVSEIALAEAGLSRSSLKTDLISSSEIRLSYEGHMYNLRYFFPVNYGKAKIQFSNAQKRIKVTCPRLRHCFVEERPSFVVSPDHQLTLPPQLFEKEVLDCHAGLQCTYEGMVTIVNYVAENFSTDRSKVIKPDDFLLEVKKIIGSLFECKSPQLFYLAPPDKKMCGMIFVSKHVLDYQHHVPAIDLAFCFLEDHSYPEVVKSMRKENCKEMTPNFKAYKLFKRALNYFAKRTNGDCKSAGVHGVYHDLVEQGVDKYFIRAIVYFLYGNPDDIDD